MNSVVLMGRLTRDPVTRTGRDDLKITRYTLAVDRRGGEGADFIPIKTFGKAAEFAEKYFRKGLRVTVSGRIETGKYEKDGKPVYTTEVVANVQEFADGKREEKKEEKEWVVGGDLPEDDLEELPFH